VNINDDLHWFIDGAVIHESKTNRAFLNMTHDEFERRLREIIGMEEVNKPDPEGVVTLENKSRGRGRPRKSESLTAIGISAEIGESFRAAKADYEKTLPYTLTQTQFVAVLLQNFQQRQ
jgi:hypothetical protein